MSDDRPRGDGPAGPLIVSDVDGVFTDQFAVVDHAVVERMAEIVRRGWALGLVTGRSHAWLDREILAPLRARIPSDLHDHVAVACEFGGVLGTCAATPPEAAGPAIPLPIRERLRDLAAEPRFATLLEWDATKLCIACVEVRHDAARLAGAAATESALRDYARAAADLVADAGCSVRQTTFAVDVAPAALSKHDGTRVVIGHSAMRPTMAMAIGDSAGDAEIAEELVASLDVPVLFAWVGPTAPPRLHRAVEVVHTALPFAQGALQALDAFEERVPAS
jgi:hydroxymethylpyrimidine pyrophosphatase-like HAD family hydrolase